MAMIGIGIDREDASAGLPTFDCAVHYAVFVPFDRSGLPGA
jgi:hypothetical protein